MGLVPKDIGTWVILVCLCGIWSPASAPEPQFSSGSHPFPCSQSLSSGQGWPPPQSWVKAKSGLINPVRTQAGLWGERGRGSLGRETRGCGGKVHCPWGVELEDEILGPSTKGALPQEWSQPEEDWSEGEILDDAVCTPGSSHPCPFLVTLANKFPFMLKPV